MCDILFLFIAGKQQKVRVQIFDNERELDSEKKKIIGCYKVR